MLNCPKNVDIWNGLHKLKANRAEQKQKQCIKYDRTFDIIFKQYCVC
jgi:hypothetical protein